jgi:hypothetical protein
MAKTKAISLYQPWASWISEGIKTVETRTHNRFNGLVGQRIAIHAGKQTDEKAWWLAEKFLESPRREQAFKIFMNQPTLPLGAIVCTAYVIEGGWICKETSGLYEHEALIECSQTRRFGLWLEGIHKLDKPVPCRGKQGIFEVEIRE